MGKKSVKIQEIQELMDKWGIKEYLHREYGRALRWVKVAAAVIHDKNKTKRVMF